MTPSYQQATGHGHKESVARSASVGGRSGRVGPAHPAAALGRALFLVQPAPDAVLLRPGQGVVEALGADRALGANALGLALPDLPLRLALTVGAEKEDKILFTARGVILPAPIGPGKHSRLPTHLGHG